MSVAQAALYGPLTVDILFDMQEVAEAECQRLENEPSYVLVEWLDVRKQNLLRLADGVPVDGRVPPGVKHSPQWVTKRVDELTRDAFHRWRLEEHSLGKLVEGGMALLAEDHASWNAGPYQKFIELGEEVRDNLMRWTAVEALIRSRLKERGEEMEPMRVRKELV